MTDLTTNNKQQTTNRNHTLDVLKGIAIILIVITHHNWEQIERLRFLFPFWIDMAVPIFMIITGYVSALSFSKRKITSLADCYHRQQLLAKWLRYLIPFIPVFLLTVIVETIFLHKNYFSLDGVILFLTGGHGPGSYYFPVMMQLVLIIPMIWAIIKKFNIYGLMICFLLNYGYEIVKTLIDMHPALYRICAFRYLFVVAVGCYIYLQKENKKLPFSPFSPFLIGFAYLIIFNYANAIPPITNQWTNTSLVAVLFISPVIQYLIENKNIQCYFLELLGKASYNIFFVQMMYYAFTNRFIHNLFIALPVCLLVGVIYYRIEYPITEKIIQKIRKL